MDIRETLRKYVKYDDIDSFASWAFGEDWDNIRNGPELKTAWNALHSREYRISGIRHLSSDIEIMIELWEQRVDYMKVFEEE